jgi:hypothetical protein
MRERERKGLIFFSSLPFMLLNFLFHCCSHPFIFSSRMTDDSCAPVDLSTKRKRDDIDGQRVSSKKKSRHHHGNDNEIPLDLSFKSNHPLPYPSAGIPSSSTIPFYDPTNLFLNSSALLYDLFLANLNSNSNNNNNNIIYKCRCHRRRSVPNST